MKREVKKFLDHKAWWFAVLVALLLAAMFRLLHYLGYGG